MHRTAVFVYGVVSYAIFFATFLYLAGFLGNFVVPKSVDSGIVGPIGAAILVNTLLVLVFGIQHTVMARPTFKKWLDKFVSKPAERSTYVMATNIALIALFWLWQPMTGTIWDVQNTIGQAVLWALFGLGWLIVLVTTFLINHFDLFGLRQVWLYFRGVEYTAVSFRNPGPYSYVRHPLYVGWLIAMWATPSMSTGHLLFAVTNTIYILVAIYFEERNLIEFHPEYAEYRKNVPMLIPRLTIKKPNSEP
jgi:protein-S-isoprenylcysteine O-methyltransferase Ste14